MTRDEARAAGLKRYDEGRECPTHKCTTRYVVNYCCVECNKRPKRQGKQIKNGPSPYIRSKIVNCLRGKFGGWISTNELVDEVYGTAKIENPVNSLHVHIHWLRRDGFPIASALTRGYRYAPELWQPLPASQAAE